MGKRIAKLITYVYTRSAWQDGIQSAKKWLPKYFEERELRVEG